MLENALFFEKNGKIAKALGALPPKPVGLRRMGIQTPKLLFPLLVSSTLKLRLIISYLNDG